MLKAGRPGNGNLPQRFGDRADIVGGAAGEIEVTRDDVRAAAEAVVNVGAVTARIDWQARRYVCGYRRGCLGEAEPGNQ